jgi:cysteine desulfurase
LVYLDNAATTKPSEQAVEGVMKGLECFGNPSSLHRLGLSAEILVGEARAAIADTLGCKTEEIFFTSGATESSNTAIFGAYKAHGKRKKRVVTTTVEHPATARPCDELEKLGCEVVRIAPDENGVISPKAIFDAVNDDTFLVTCMLVNNETGAVLPVQRAFGMIKKKYPDVITHCDCVQGFMKLPVKTKKLGADLISLSGHKVCAPKGIGALYVKKGVHIPPYMLGGGQEKGFRSGTESVPLICGFGAAVKALAERIDENYSFVKTLESYLFKRVAETEGLEVNYTAEKSPYVNSISVDRLKSEVVLHFLEEKEIYVSSGSACSKGKKSGVLQQFGIPDNRLDTTLRISFSPNSTTEEIDLLIDALKEAQTKLAKLN